MLNRTSGRVIMLQTALLIAAACMTLGVAAAEENGK
jgi:hypothetical protein